MPALIPDCIKRVEDDGDRVILANPAGGEVRMNAWEARLLPFLEAGADARTIAARAGATGLNMPLDHIQALLLRLSSAGLLLAPPAPPTDQSATTPAAGSDARPPPTARPAADDRPTTRASAASGEEPTPVPVGSPEPPEAAQAPQAAFQEEAADLENLGLNVPLPSIQMNTPLAGSWTGAKPQPPMSGSAAPGSGPQLVAPTAEPLVPRPDVRAAQVPAPSAPAMPLQAVLQPGSPPPQAWLPQAAPVSAPAPVAAAPPRWGRRLLLVLVPIALVLSLEFIPWPFGLKAPCVLQPVERRQVRIPVDAVIDQVKVEEGQAVKAGEVLAVLELTQLKADQERTVAAVAGLESELKRLKYDSRPDISKMRQLVELRSAEMRVAYLEMRRLEALKENALAPEADAEKAAATLLLAKRSLTEAQTVLADAMSATPDDIRLKEAELERLRITLARQNELVAAPEIRSPVDGTIATANVRGRVGQTVKAGGELLEIVRLERMRVEARLPQQSVGKAHVGARVTISVSGVAQQFLSRLEVVGSTIEMSGGERFVRVVAFVDNPQLLLRQNADGWLELQTERESVLRVLLLRAGLADPASTRAPLSPVELR